METVRSRILSRKAGAMLLRNTVVSCCVFAVGLGLLWFLVERGHLSEMPAMIVSTLLSNTLHYLLGRGWIYRGTDRGWGDGYFYFLINAGKVLPYWYLGTLNEKMLLFDLPLLPVVLAGTMLGVLLNRRVPGEWFSRIVLVFVLITGIQLLLGK